MKVVYVSVETKDQLDCIASKNDTYDDVVSKLIVSYLKVEG